MKYILMLFLMAGLYAATGQVVQPINDKGQKWHDVDGNYINAHGAGILLHNNMYYMFGEVKKGKTWLVPDQQWEDYRVPAGGVSCYSSTDLKRWKYEGMALNPTIGRRGYDLDTGMVIERPKVVYNEKTKQFVMWMHIDKNDYSYSQLGVAVSKSPAGPYKYLGSVKPNGFNGRDMTVFKDDDGKAYLVFASEQNATMHVCLLNDDYRSPSKKYSRILVNRTREAPALFKNGNKYYLLTSGCTGWSPNELSCATASDPLGPWTELGNPCVGKDSATTFQSQGTFVLPMDGGYIFMADQWYKTDLEKSGYLWLPLIFEHGKPVIRNKEERGSSSKSMISDTVRVGGLRIVEVKLLASSAAAKDSLEFSLDFVGANGDGLLHLSNKNFLNERPRPFGDYTISPPGTHSMIVTIKNDQEINKLRVDSLVINTQLEKQTGGLASLLDLDKSMIPYWNTDTVFNEAVLMHADSGKTGAGNLLFAPRKILSVKSFDGLSDYAVHKDYTRNGSRLTAIDNGSMPVVADSFFSRKNLAWYDIQSRWVNVTYTTRDQWKGPKLNYRGDAMPNTVGLLKKKDSLVIVAYGMSITRGMNVSAYDSVAPFMPTYVELFTRALKKYYADPNVVLYNAALPGSTAEWGARSLDTYVSPLHPNLVLLDFGMNDFWHTSPSLFRTYLETMIAKIHKQDPGTEIILVANLEFDPAFVSGTDSNNATYHSNFEGYATVLEELQRQGVVCLNMTAVSKFIYSRKKPKDCLANPLHPNDYMARWYAQGLSSLLIP